ncbi:MAG TPA: amino acid ABC transporter permease [Trebonia sp.]|jgi:polar amino acid transport system permease protein|nr:amino acid ABC transporter permease [Trebonia sp.]
MNESSAELLALTRVRNPHHLRKVAAVVVVLILAFWIQGLARNKALDWSTVGQYLFNTAVLQGLQRTIIITVISIVIAIVLGAVLANMRLSKNPVLRGTSWLYIWFFRSIPLLVLLIIAYNFSLLYPRLGLGVPFGGELFSINVQQSVSPLTASIVAFGLQQAAYTSEVVRASILSVPAGQQEAATALGMTKTRTMLRIVFPQALRVAVPPVANESINLLKSTSLVAFISVPDLLYSVQQIYSSTFQVMPLLVVASLWYMLIVSLMTALQYFIERRLRNGPGQSARQRPERALDRLESIETA